MKLEKLHSVAVNYLSLLFIGFFQLAYAILSAPLEPDIDAFLHSRPGIPGTVDSAYAIFYETKAGNMYEKYERSIIQKQEALYQLSGRKSRLLAMLRNKYKLESTGIDFAAIHFERDKKLDRK